MGTISVSLPSDGDTIDAADYNTPINAIVDEVNGSLDNSNLASDAAISGSKIADSGITTAKIADDAVTPAKRSGGYYIGTISGATLGSTGNKAITGVGFTPKIVRFKVLPTAGTTSTVDGSGSMTSAAQFAHATASSTSGPSFSRRSETNLACLWLAAGSTSASMAFSYVSMDADGFTINVVTASSSFPVAFEAIA